MLHDVVDILIRKFDREGWILESFPFKAQFVGFIPHLPRSLLQTESYLGCIHPVTHK